MGVAETVANCRTHAQPEGATTTQSHTIALWGPFSRELGNVFFVVLFCFLSVKTYKYYMGQMKTEDQKATSLQAPFSGCASYITSGTSHWAKESESPRRNDVQPLDTLIVLEVFLEGQFVEFH